MSTMTQSHSIENLGFGVTRELLHERRILIYTVKIESGMIRETMDLWAKSVIADLRKWPANQTLLLMHDAREVEFTNYIRHKVDEVNKATPPRLRAYTAVIVKRGMLGYFLSTLTQATGRFFRGRIETQVFFDRDLGIAWLEEHLTP